VRPLWQTTALITVFTFAACAETAAIHSYPPGARLSVNGKVIGITPVEFRVPRDEWVDRFDYVLERPGYETMRGELPQGVTKARIIGAIVTSGILLVFKRPTNFKRDRFDFEMTPTGVPPAATAPPVPPASAPVVREERAPIACSAEQVLAMKRSGLSDDQVRRACEK